MMTREERAKQFAPFDAMKGLQEALRDREEKHTRVERHELSEEQMEENAETLVKLTKGTEIILDCYRAFHDVQLRGIISRMDLPNKFIVLGNEKIYFCDIYKIEIVNYPSEHSRSG